MTAPTRLSDRRALITGAASGIGLATARRFIAEGARVALLDRDAEALDRAQRDLEGDTICLEVDVTDERRVASAVGSVTDAWGGLDVLVSNAAVQMFGDDAPVHQLDTDVWERTLAVNLTGTFFVCKHGIAALLASAGGSVILTASPTSLYGLAAGFDAYSASKGGVLALARVMANDYASHGIRVNAVIPGVTQTPLIRSLTDDDEATRAFVDQIPLGRLGHADDVAGVMAFLACDDSTYATGGIFTIDGGITAV